MKEPEKQLPQPEMYEDPDYVWSDEGGEDVDWIQQSGTNAGHKTDKELFDKKDESDDAGTPDGTPADDQPEA